MFKTKVLAVALLVVTAVLLGATVFREPIASAAQLLNVQVMNGPANPVPVTSRDDPARSVFAFFKNETMDANDAQHHLAVEVPAGKRLVIEAVSGSAGFDTATEALLEVSVHARVNGKLQIYDLPAVFIGRSPVAVFPYLWDASDTVRLYADGGTSLDVFWTRNTATAGEANLNISIQGYLIDCTTAACA